MSITFPKPPAHDTVDPQLHDANAIYEKLWALANNLWWS